MVWRCPTRKARSLTLAATGKKASTVEIRRTHSRTPAATEVGLATEDGLSGDPTPTR
jgi:hypothetical protein